MKRSIFWLSSVFTVLALAIFALSLEPYKLFIVVFPLALYFPIALNKRRKTIALSFKDALLAYIPVYGRKQLRDLYFAKP